MTSWAPIPAALKKISETISRATIVNNAAVQRDVTQELDSFTREVDYIAYLAYILASMPQDQLIRTMAGYLVKNNARLILRSSPDVLEYVKKTILQAFDDVSIMVRNVASLAVVTFLGTPEPKNWPECLSHVVGALEDPDFGKQEAALKVLKKACEDYPRKLDVKINGMWALEFMIPKFMMLSAHPRAKMRSHAIVCLSYCQSLFTHIDTFIVSLFTRASDEDPSVRRHVCQAFVLLLASRPEKLMPEINNVAEYMLYLMKDKNENVALEACEFWLMFAEDPDLAPYLHPVLARVAPVLLDCMVYGEDDLLLLDADEDAAVPDKETDIKPKYQSGKSRGFEHEGNDEGTSKPRVGAYGEELEDEDDEGFDDLDDDEFAEEMSTEWNLRKCAAAALDVLAVRFGADLLNVLLEPLKLKLWSEDWLPRESGILALGAMAQGCIDAVEPHLPTLVPYLINMLGDRKPLVRSISCWTLGRYASWFTQPVYDHRNAFFIPALEGLLVRAVLQRPQQGLA